MNVNEFNDDYLNELLGRISKKYSHILFPSNFNINLLNFDTKHQDTGQNLINKIMLLNIFQLNGIKY